MKHDERCEITKGGGGNGRYGCLCATRAYDQNPWTPDDENWTSRDDARAVPA